MLFKVFASDCRHKVTVFILMLLSGYNITLAEDLAKEGSWTKVIIPEAITLQYAGNIGLVSGGPTWIYGNSDQLETQILLGYLPKEVMFNDYFCLTVKQCYLPYCCEPRQNYSFNPLVVSLAANSLFSGEFWYSEPGSKYYNVSTKLRFHLGFGSRLNLSIPHKQKPKHHQQRLSIYYEFSTYDLALLSYVRGTDIHLVDILNLGIGFQYKFF